MLNATQARGAAEVNYQREIDDRCRMMKSLIEDQILKAVGKGKFQTILKKVKVELAERLMAWLTEHGYKCERLQECETPSETEIEINW
jgi:phage antirepressor YoqD-like protein